MKRIKPTLIATVIAVFGVCAQSAFATNYYFDSVNGSDSNNCTSTTTPCKTLAKANSIALAAGDQEEFLRGDTWTGELDVTHSGSSGHRVNYFGYGTGSSRPKITGGGSDGACIDATASYITINNLYVTGCGTSGDYVGVLATGANTEVENMQASNNVVGIEVTGSSDVQVNNNTISNNNIADTSDPKGYGGAEGIVDSSPGATVNNNTISGSDVLSGSSYVGSGLLLASVGTNEVKDNIINNNHVGVQFSSGSTGGSTNSIEYNAIGSSVTGDSGVMGIDEEGSFTNSWISHNSIDAVGSSAIGLKAKGVGGETVTSNAVDGGQYSFYDEATNELSGVASITGNDFAGASHFVDPEITLDGTNQTASPVWVSAPTNLAESASSPTIDAATEDNFSTDILGNTTPDVAGSQTDQGAYEYQGAGPHCGPCTLTVTDTDTANGTGSVESDPGGISCGTTCSASFNYGTDVDLNGYPGSNSTVTWSGPAGCNGQQWQGCSFAMTGSESATATFNDPTSAVPEQAADVPVNWSYSTYSGTDPTGVLAGENLTAESCGTSCWTNSPSSFSYQWDDCDVYGDPCTDISGATSASYTVQSSDVVYSGSTPTNQVEVNICATNSNGTTCTGPESGATVYNAAGGADAPENLQAANATYSPSAGWVSNTQNSFTITGDDPGAPVQLAQVQWGGLL